MRARARKTVGKCGIMPEGIHRQQTKQRRRLGHRRGARAADALVLTNMLLVLAVRSGVRRAGMAVFRAAHAVYVGYSVGYYREVKHP